MPGFRLLSEAKEELEAGVSFYNAEQSGLGHDFALEVRRLCRLIAKSPAAGFEVRSDVRRRILRRFPYSILSVLLTMVKFWSSQSPTRVGGPDIGAGAHRV